MDNLIDPLQIKITEARNLLQKESREAIDNVNWKLIILGMDKKYNPDQLESLQTETELLLCGILNPEDYPKELEDRMHITKEESNLLIGEMDRLIFKKIQEDLEKRLIIKEKIAAENKPVVFDPRFISMPKEDQEAIAHSNWKEKLYEIASKYKLTVEQMGILEETTVRLMTNAIHTDRYESELTSKIRTSKENISNIVNDVNEKIFKQVRELLKMQSVPNNLETNDEVPLPPYAKVINNNQLPINNEGKIIEKKEEPKLTEDSLSNIIKINKLPEITEKSIIEEIPKPVEKENTFNIIKINKNEESVKPTQPIFQPLDIPKNMLEEKLKDMMAGSNTNSNDQAQKATIPTSLNSHDPYREII